MATPTWHRQEGRDRRKEEEEKVVGV